MHARDCGWHFELGAGPFWRRVVRGQRVRDDARERRDPLRGVRQRVPLRPRDGRVHGGRVRVQRVRAGLRRLRWERGERVRGVAHLRRPLRRLRKGWYWPDAHNEVIRRILKMAHRGTRVVFVAGNHDEMLRDYAGFTFGGVELVLEAIHETADGRRLLVTHGDSFDGVVLYAKWLALLGDKAYSLLLRTNFLVNAVRRQFKMPYWSLSARFR